MSENTPRPQDGDGTPAVGPVGSGPAPDQPRSQTPPPTPGSPLITAAAYGFAMPWAGMGVVFGAFIALMGAAFSDLGPLLVVVIVLVLAALPASALGVWWLGRTALKRNGGRAPKAVAWVGTGCFVLSALTFYGGSTVDHLAAVGPAAGLVVGAGCALVERSPRLRAVGIAVAVVGALAAPLAMPPLIEWYEERSERSTAMGDPGTDFAVLDGPDWTRTGFSDQYGRLNLYYKHRGGDRVRVETWNGTHDEPVDVQCDYPQMECERRDGLVIVREEGEIDKVRTVLPDGTVVAVFPAQHDGEADLVAAAQDVRPGTQEEREQIIDSPEE
ncbi:response regulator [Nocardiopsis sp. RSe5-2]|uniref:Response regulator n=1 Tax=Nocardiopsis endophytica TaxID=3018445 RepID=A0ABT4U5G9_9ACTN|nr:response regulator [Nocardiopsis endophytica]MDA2812192.1 response regulator [Nocardiopsis endophytica]